MVFVNLFLDNNYKNFDWLLSVLVSTKISQPFWASYCGRNQYNISLQVRISSVVVDQMVKKCNRYQDRGEKRTWNEMKLKHFQVTLPANIELNQRTNILAPRCGIGFTLESSPHLPKYPCRQHRQSSCPPFPQY